jgi:hypothetical protein
VRGHGFFGSPPPASCLAPWCSSGPSSRVPTSSPFMSWRATRPWKGSTSRRTAQPGGSLTYHRSTCFMPRKACAPTSSGPDNFPSGTLTALWVCPSWRTASASPWPLGSCRSSSARLPGSTAYAWCSRSSGAALGCSFCSGGSDWTRGPRRWAPCSSPSARSRSTSSTIRMCGHACGSPGFSTRSREPCHRPIPVRSRRSSWR